MVRPPLPADSGENDGGGGDDVVVDDDDDDDDGARCCPPPATSRTSSLPKLSSSLPCKRRSAGLAVRERKDQASLATPTSDETAAKTADRKHSRATRRTQMRAATARPSPRLDFSRFFPSPLAPPLQLPLPLNPPSASGLSASALRRAACVVVVPSQGGWIRATPDDDDDDDDVHFLCVQGISAFIR